MNNHQGGNVDEIKYGPTPQSTTEQSVGGNGMRLLQGGVNVRVPRVYVANGVTDASGIAVFYLTNDGTNGGLDRFSEYSHIIARVNSSTALYAISWARVGHTLTVTVNEVTIVALVLNFAPAVGVTVGIHVEGGNH